MQPGFFKLFLSGIHDFYTQKRTGIQEKKRKNGASLITYP
jgi:hypothetical protein